MTSNFSPDRHPLSSPGHIADVQTTLGEATTSATELGDLLSAGLAADDQHRHAESGAATQAQRADDGDVR